MNTNFYLKNCVALLSVLIILSFSACQKNAQSPEAAKAALTIRSSYADAVVPYTIPATLGDSTVAYWPLSFGNSSDFSGDVNDGQNNDVQPTTDHSGHTGGAMHFNGINGSYILVKDAQSLRLANTDFTINAWIKTADAGNISNIMDKLVNHTTNGWGLDVGNSANANVLTYISGSSIAAGTTGISSAAWHMVTTVYHLSTKKLYFFIDGAADDSVANIASPGAGVTALLYIGKHKPTSGTTAYFKGAMSDLRLYHRAITGTEIQELYTIPTAPTGGLIGYWPFFYKNVNDITGNNPGATTPNSSILYFPDRLNDPKASAFFTMTNSFSYVEVPDNSGLRLSGTDFTVNLWIDNNSIDGNYNGASILSKGALAGGTNQGWGLQLTDTSNVIKVAFGTVNGQNSYSKTPLTAYKWHMVTCLYVLAKQQLSIYIDGKLDKVNNGILPPSATNDAPLYFAKQHKIGRDYLYYKGGIDDVRIYNRTLTSGEIQQLYMALN